MVRTSAWTAGSVSLTLVGKLKIPHAMNQKRIVLNITKIIGVIKIKESAFSPCFYRGLPFNDFSVYYISFPYLIFNC